MSARSSAWLAGMAGPRSSVSSGPMMREDVAGTHLAPDQHPARQHGDSLVLHVFGLPPEAAAIPHLARYPGRSVNARTVYYVPPALMRLDANRLEPDLRGQLSHISYAEPIAMCVIGSVEDGFVCTFSPELGLHVSRASDLSVMVAHVTAHPSGTAGIGVFGRPPPTWNSCADEQTTATARLHPADLGPDDCAAWGAYPAEAVGLLGGTRGTVKDVYGLRNLAPRREFFADPYDQYRAFQSMKAEGERLLATFHSHPEGAALLSEADRESVFEVAPIAIVIALRAFEHSANVAAFSRVPGGGEVITEIVVRS